MICAELLRNKVISALMIAEENEEFAVELMVRAHKRISCGV